MQASRRVFLQSAAFTGIAFSQNTAPVASPVPPEQRVNLVGDGVALTPTEYLRLMTKIIDQQGRVADSYLQGGAVEELEKKFAIALGKERALFLPTGTLANHLAVRELAGEKRRAIVQQESHLYADEGDCAQLLSGMNLVPLAAGRATMRLEEIAAVVEKSGGPPYPVPVGAISIESPVRRATGEVFDFEEMKKISAYAREKKIGMHLDGARMYLASGYTGIAPVRYASLFDTVYVSLYKYFNAPFGGVLAGPAAMIKRVEEMRHPFGSLIYHGWEPAAIALHYFDGFGERYQTAVQNGEKLIRLLEASGKFHIERIENGSNIANLNFPGGTVDELRQRLAKSGIMIRATADPHSTMLMVNETISRRSPEDISSEFVRAVS